jgi:hypothetical protein
LYSRRIHSLLPLLIPLLLARLTLLEASSPPLINETGHAVFRTLDYLAACGVTTGPIAIGSFTLEQWVQIRSDVDLGAVIPLFSYATDGAQDQLLVWNSGYNASGKQFRLNLMVQGETVQSGRSTAWNLADGAWHHIAVTRTRDPTCVEENRQCGVDGPNARQDCRRCTDSKCCTVSPEP